MTERDGALERAELLLALRKRGIRDTMVLRAFEQVPRDLFVEAGFRDIAWTDQALPIDCGQTISQPAVVAMMTDALELKPAHTVLEVGTGSGYHAAILGHIAGQVVSVERFRTLAELAAGRLRELGLDNVEVFIADGMLGYPARAPFDRIVLNAAVGEVPEVAVRAAQARRHPRRAGRAGGGDADADALPEGRGRAREARARAGALRADAARRGLCTVKLP